MPISIFGCSSSAIKCWTKKKTLDFFDTFLGTQQYRDFSKIWGGLLFCKSRNNLFIKEWLHITLNHPDLVKDPDEEEIKNQHSTYNGYHRHDQSIITPLAFKYQNNDLTILPEIFDENKLSKIIITSRNRITKQMYRKVYIKYHLQGLLGISRYNKIKKKFNL